ncbi:hypothetical protein ACFPYI_18865 [Halomarina salina]|uniref:DUF2238 domain-containing protein n=1 Tax=Halomarina salina TaxID=1872699 RepID=A0ABD5RSK2_9EURY|nr:hypothetical protein [Halomarina salina]
MSSSRFGGAITTPTRNAALGWSIVAMLAVLMITQVAIESYRWGFFLGLALALIVLPAVALRDISAMPPWELLVLVAIPAVDAILLGETVLSPVTVYLGVAAVALIVAVDVRTYTQVQMNRSFTVALVVIATLATGATWNVALWIADGVLGTSYLLGGRTQDAANHVMMIDFLYAASAGLLAGILFTVYLRRRSFEATSHAEAPGGEAGERPEPTPSLTRGRFNLSERRVTQITVTMQVILGVLLLYGLVVRDVPTITNASIALLVTFLPAALEHNYRLPMEPELVIWLTTAAFLHTLGSAGLYDLIGQWDSLTHSLSASIVAATGYTLVRTIDLHSADVYLPSRTMFAFILLFILAVGVVWELVEFALDLAADRYGFDAALAQHGVSDTVTDLLFNLAGAIIAATLGATYLTNVSHQIAERFGN